MSNKSFAWFRSEAAKKVQSPFVHIVAAKTCQTKRPITSSNNLAVQITLQLLAKPYPLNNTDHHIM